MSTWPHGFIEKKKKKQRDWESQWVTEAGLLNKKPIRFQMAGLVLIILSVRWIWGFY